MKKICFFIFILAVPALVAAQAPLNLVPAGCQEGCPCTLCDLYTLGHNIVKFLLFAGAIPVAAIAFLWGGTLMLTSQGNENKITQGKTAITNAVIGLALAFFAWIIINALLGTLVFRINFGAGLRPSEWFNPPQCESGGGTESCKIPETAGGGGGPTGQTALGSDNATWLSLKTQLRNNIDRNRTCNEAANYGTCLGGLKPDSIQGIKELQAACNCKLVINGGSEIGGPGGVHDSTGPTGTTAGTHVGGDKVDYAQTPELNNYIMNNAQRAGTRQSDGAPLYKQGNIVYANEGNHWDVCYANCK